MRGLGRPRLDAMLDHGRPTGLVLVGGPPGIGKTSTVAQWSTGLDVPVAWYRAVAADPAAAPVPTSTVLDHLAAALDVALGTGPGSAGGRTTVDQLVLRLEHAPGHPVVVVDDVHLLGPADHSRLEEFALDAIDQVCLVLVGRDLPGWNLARGELVDQVQLDHQDLRFRPWEVETLFRERYAIPLGSADAVELTRRTGGWAAGLSLLHGALRRLGPGAIAPALSSLTERARYASAYLEDQVYVGVSAADREFLRRTAAFDVLTVARCNALLEVDDSATTLRRLREVPLLLEVDESGENFRVHPAIRRHVATELADRLGPDAMRAWHRRAADTLAGEEVSLEHLVARCRAQDWDGVRALLDLHGPALTTTQTDAWVRLLPDHVIDADPWAGLARAVALLEDGRFLPAVQAARSARVKFSDARGRRACDHVVRRASVWTSADTTSPTRWEDVLRASTVRDPASAAQRAHSLDSPMRLVCEGVALILAGNHERAAVVLRRCAQDPAADVVAQLSARLLLAAVAALGDRAGVPVPDLDSAHTEAELHGLSWLARMARGVAVARGGQRHDLDIAAALVEECDAMGDKWGAALIALGSALAELRAGECDIAAIESLVERFRALDAGVLEAWTRALYAVTAVHEGLPDAFRDARLAEALAKANSVPGALSLAYAALGASEVSDRAEYTRLAEATGRAAGLGAKPWTWLKSARAHGRPATSATAPVVSAPAAASLSATDTLPVAASVAPPAATAPVSDLTTLSVLPPADPTPAATLDGPDLPVARVHCFGGFTLELDGSPVDLGGVRPRARSVLRLLCLHAGRPVHRELLAELFWPDLTVRSALHNLHVTVSSLRGALEPDVAPRASRLLVRDGQAYTLVLAPTATSDLREFDLALRAATAARHRDDVEGHLEALQRATDLYVGEVLPEDGPAEWVVQVREEYRMRAAEAAYALATGRLERGDPAAAARSASQAVRVDRWHDGAWRVLIEALERTGDRAAAGRAKSSYADVLAGLGV
ncbi:BTAD domain-containing putative transcriptional regulator [Jatrophihabitans sp. YIM 134969]